MGNTPLRRTGKKCQDERNKSRAAEIKTKNGV
jgi:hypothetical protein